MKKFIIGLVGGVVGAAINSAQLIFASDIETEVYISTAITWIAIGILIAACNFKINGILKGIVVSILVSASSLVYTITSSFTGALWTIAVAVILGAIMGYCIDNKKP